MEAKRRLGQSGDLVPTEIARHPIADAAGMAGRRVELVEACGTCRAPVDKKVFALNCRSCGGFLMQDSDLTERARPDALLPFSIDEGVARAAFAAWISSRRFAPQALVKGDRQVRAIHGVFLPVWSYRANTSSTYVGQRGEERTRMVPRTRTDSEGKSEVSLEPESYTEWYPTSGRVSRYFDTVLVPGCSPLTEKLPPWPLTALAPYTQGASQTQRIVAYDVEPEHGFEQATAEMGKQIHTDVCHDIGGSAQQVGSVSTTYTDQAYSLLLLPAWLGSYTHGGRVWSVLVNGASGEVVGERPYSGAKIATLVAVLIAVVVAVVLLIWH